MSKSGDGLEPPATQSEIGSHVSFSSILEEHDVARQQRDVRKKLLQELEQSKFNDGKKAAALGYVSHSQLVSSDIPVLGNMLLKIGDVHTLNLILHSPGGDGTVVENFVALCRTHCKKFRIWIPTEAKSAATLISLGADEIVMGPPSEIGPIDAQVPVMVSGIERYASAQSFIDARDDLLAKHAEAIKNGDDPSAILQMLASLDLPFIVECERLMDFGRDVGQKLLEAYMFSRKPNKTDAAEEVVKQLSSVQLHKVHGRTINGQAAKRDLGLKIKLCGNDDPIWRKMWEWYTRAEIMLAKSQSFKMFETRFEQLSASYR